MNATESPASHSFSRREFIKSTGAFALLLRLGTSVAPGGASAAFASPKDAANYHFLNRISWGVRPRDMGHIAQIGISAYLEEQLTPGTLPGFKDFIAPTSILRVPRARLLRMKDASEVAYKVLMRTFVGRATSSPAQLYERVVEFWSDHFNVASEELEVDVLDFQRAVIRPLALGKFRDLLLAIAKHPAMLQYLDNYLNVAEHPNENYAREVMELHTLGVDGGYTERDVKEVARALTGWTTDYEFWGEGFHFDPETHDDGAKSPLGLSLAPGGGMNDGIAVLSALANHPSTARFVCRKLAARFVSDIPAPSLVDRMVATWTANDGAIKPVLRTMFLSTEFAASAGVKLRKPLDFFVGALRMTGTKFSDFWYQDYLLSKLGQVPYGWGPPNGYPEPATAWGNANGLLERWNTAQVVTDDALTAGPADGLNTPLNASIGPAATAGELVDRCARQLLLRKLDAGVRGELIGFVANGGPATTRLTRDLREEKLGTLCGLLLASPLFQWR